MRILVIGAGIGGLTFVRALQYFQPLFNFNCTIEIAERSSSFRDGLGIVLHPNGAKVLKTIGIHQLQHSHIIRTIGGKQTIDLHKVWGEGNYTRSILRKDLHTLLAQGLNIKMGTAVNISLQDTAITAHFENGESKTYDLVVGADGVHSQVRETLFPNTPATSTGLFYFRFIAKNTQSTWTTFETEQVTLGFIPLANDLMHCFVQLQTTEYPCRRGEEEEYFEKTIAPQHPLLSEAFTNRCGPLHAGFACIVPPGNWSRGNCVLLGDAAHAVSPTLSLGGALAMEDALVLALALCQSASIPQAIDLYRTARETRCVWAYKMALSQLNSLRRKRVTSIPDASTPTQLLKEMYKPFLQDPVPEFIHHYTKQKPFYANQEKRHHV